MSALSSGPQGVDSETHFAELRLDFAGYFLKVAALPRTKD
jgi:hypothetical protein